MPKPACLNSTPVKIAARSLAKPAPSRLVARLTRWAQLHLNATLLTLLLSLTCLSLPSSFSSANLDAQARLAQQLRATMDARYGADGVALLDAWQRMIAAQQDQTELQKISAVNDFFNRHIHYTEDSVLWHTSDYWATPLETLGVRAGDCEDYTIAKYVSLVQLGIPIERLRLIYVKARLGNAQSKIYQAHMVLGYYPNTTAVPWILDNLVASLELANNRPDLRPVFSFNSEGLWIGNQQALVDPTARLSRWRDLLNRTRQEGFILSTQ